MMVPLLESLIDDAIEQAKKEYSEGNLELLVVITKLEEAKKWIKGKVTFID